MKRGLMRPTAVLFPAVLLLAAIFGNESSVDSLFVNWCMIQLLSLCSVDSFRNAAAREPGVRRVDRRFSGAFLTILLGIAATGLIQWRSKLFSFRTGDVLLLVEAATAINEQMFEERMFALSHPSDGAILSVVSNLLLLAGLLLDSSGGVAAPAQAFYTACGAGLGMMISVVASYVIEPMHGFSLSPRNIAFFPKAAVQKLLYPAVTFVLSALLIRLKPEEGSLNDVFRMEYQVIFAGWILWRLSRTICRRAGDESRPLNLLLIAAAAIPVLACAWLPAQGYAAAATLALVCAAIVFCAPGVRFYGGAALVLAAFALQIGRPLPEMWNTIAMAVCCAAAVILNLHKAFLRRV